MGFGAERISDSNKIKDPSCSRGLFIAVRAPVPARETVLSTTGEIERKKRRLPRVRAPALIDKYFLELAIGWLYYLD